MKARRSSQRTAQESAALAARCPVISRVLEVTGPPRWRARPSGFEGLARIIIEQQVSVPSANAILARVNQCSEGLDPARFHQLTDDQLRAVGLSRPKIRYIRALAYDVTEGRFDFARLSGLSDADAAIWLQSRLGVGRWSAAVYLLFCEDRRDIWPRSDVALLAAHRMAGGHFARSELKAFDAWAEETYAPYRGTAAHILWGQIAHMRGRTPL